MPDSSPLERSAPASPRSATAPLPDEGQGRDEDEPELSIVIEADTSRFRAAMDRAVYAVYALTRWASPPSDPPIFPRFRLWGRR